MYATLFDRFESSEEIGADRLAVDLADILSGRRAFAGRELGVLSWGLPSMANITSKSPQDRQRVADYIADALDRFEPRLEDVRVVPIEDSVDFSFRIEGRLVGPGSSSITLRILSPMVGGGLGAQVVVLDVRRGGEA